MSPFRWERDAATKFGSMQLVVFMPKCPLPWFAAGGAAAVTIGDGHKNESQLLFPSLPLRIDHRRCRIGTLESFGSRSRDQGETFRWKSI
jgi:hypothetical protein